MKYIFVFLIFFLIGCENQHHKTKNIDKNISKNIETSQPKIVQKIDTIKIDDLEFKKNNNITYKFNKNKILVFLNDNKLSKSQIEELKKLHQKYYIIKNKELQQYFNILTFPTIIITKDNNHTKKYEGFMPYEILKYEIKDKN